MEIGCENYQKPGMFARGWCCIRDFPHSSLDKFVQFARLTKKTGEDDPRRVMHSLKVGLALTLVSLFYYLKPLYKSFGVSAMWAVMTVVVVFEFSVGATIGKGLNRGLATLLAGGLGIGAHHLACMTGKVGQPIILGMFVFLQAVVSTFIRFFPRVKARYDYGWLMFILTFCLVSISGFQTDEILDLVQKRISTVFIGASICVTVSIFVCPVWAGQDLHDLVATHIEKLGNFLEGFGEEYFATASGEAGLKADKSFLVGYRSVLNSKSTEENLANLASWEPGHGKFMYCHPWKQYLKIATVARQCAFRIEALSSNLNSEIKASQEIRQIVQDPCTKICKESGQALKELSVAIRKMTMSPSPNPHVVNSKAAAQNLKSLLKSDSWEHTNLLQVMPVAAVASLLVDVVMNVEDIAESVNELASLAKFMSSELKISTAQIPSGEAISKQFPMDECPHVIIPVTVTAPTTSK